MTCAVRERPILFSGQMVRAILRGEKAQTRRVVAGAGCQQATEVVKEADGWWFYDTINRGCCGPINCPYGQPGDRLWVREAFWCKNDTCDHEYCGGCDMGSLLTLGQNYAEIDYCATPACLTPPTTKQRQTVEAHIGEPAPGASWWLSPPDDWDGSENDHTERGVWCHEPWRFFTKHPSIHMPRWASRITLEVTEVRVERVQEISWRDAAAEGVSAHPHGCPGCLSSGECGSVPRVPDEGCGVFVRGYVDSFRRLWDSINAGRGYAWESNPWVWCVSFRVVKP